MIKSKSGNNDDDDNADGGATIRIKKTTTYIDVDNTNDDGKLRFMIGTRAHIIAVKAVWILSRENNRRRNIYHTRYCTRAGKVYLESLSLERE